MKEFPGSPVVKTPYFHCQGAQISSLVRELRSHMLQGVAKSKYINWAYVLKSAVYICMKVCVSRLVVSDSLQPDRL